MLCAVYDKRKNAVCYDVFHGGKWYGSRRSFRQAWRYLQYLQGS